MEVLYEGEQLPYALALDERYLYWASDTGLRRAPLDGGAPVTLASAPAVRSLAPAGDYLYFSRGSIDVPGGIGRVPRDGGEVEWVADATNPHSLVANADGVFWADWGDDGHTGRLARAGLDGSGPTELAAGLVSPRSIALDGEQLYFESPIVDTCPTGPAQPECTAFFRVSISGGAPERVVSSAIASSPVWHEGAMYWLAGAPFASDVVMLPPGGEAQPVADMLMDGPNRDRLWSDAEAMYWDTGARVLRMAFATRQVQRLVTGLDENSFAVLGDAVYAAEGTSGRILRIATDGSAYRPTAAPITGPCPTPVGSAGELAATPRTEPNLELLAFELEPQGVVASQGTYDRLSSDVTAIRILEPTLAEVTYYPPHDGRHIQLEWTGAARSAFADGLYTAWDCLNEAYGLRSFSAHESWIELELRGIYNNPLVLERYLQLPGVERGVAGARIDDGSTICVSRDGDRYQYVFDDTGGNCAGQCGEHRAYQFASGAPGEVTQLAVWDSTTGAPVPPWFGAICHYQPLVEPSDRLTAGE